MCFIGTYYHPQLGNKVRCKSCTPAHFPLPALFWAVLGGNISVPSTGFESCQGWHVRRGLLGQLLLLMAPTLPLAVGLWEWPCPCGWGVAGRCCQDYKWSCAVQGGQWLGLAPKKVGRTQCRLWQALQVAWAAPCAFWLQWKEPLGIKIHTCGADGYGFIKVPNSVPDEGKPPVLL